MVSTVIGWIALAPPVEGAILLLPLDQWRSGPVIDRAVRGGARLLRAGPIPGSYIFLAEKQALAEAAGGSPSLMLAAPSAACGSVPAIQDRSSS